MDEFDIFTNEIKFPKPLYKKMLHEFVHEGPSTVIAPNYQSGMRLLAVECLADNDEDQAAFYFSEAVSASIRVMTTYREEQRNIAGSKIKTIEHFVKPVQEIESSNKITRNDPLSDILFKKCETLTLDALEAVEDPPFHLEYLKFSKLNNVDNFHRILKELPKEWTIIQLTAPYNPNENLKLFKEYCTEVDSIYLSVFTNDYLELCGMKPITINLPANVTKVGEKPLFQELYSILDENYKTIDNAHALNNKRLVQNYWSRREDVDLRMKSVINVMDKQWLGGFSCLLTGKLIDQGLKARVVAAVDRAIADWGYIRLTNKQKFLLYNLIESCTSMTSEQIKSGIRKILTEHGNTEDVRQVLEPCENCTKDFKLVTEVCLKCLSKCFKMLHHFTLVEGIRAFSEVATLVREGDDWAQLKKAKRYPVILIVDEILDTFPWENLPALIHQPASRIENIHFLYYLYKLHESDVTEGYFITRGRTGRYIINPENNLDRMEKRMNSFVQYWCKDWEGHVSRPPPPEDFVNYLTTADILLYCGHGDGCQFAGGGIEGARGARAACVLSGCGSARLQPGAGRAPPAAAHRRLLGAGSPMIVGMLWEVTDLEVDKVVSALVALCVPSAARPAWRLVGKAGWSRGELDTSVEQTGQFESEPDILRALCCSRSSTNFVMISASVVARGMPVRIR